MKKSFLSKTLAGTLLSVTVTVPHLTFIWEDSPVPADLRIPPKASSTAYNEVKDAVDTNLIASVHIPGCVIHVISDEATGKIFFIFSAPQTT